VTPALNDKTIGVPGVSVEVGGSASRMVLMSVSNMAIGSTMTDFESIKHLLSGKPLRRPNRSRPLDEPRQ
jgi:hypothetical protein